jgi:hypothetical protein
MVIAPSTLSLQLASEYSLGASAEFLGISRRRYSGSWKPKFGVSATYDESSNELTVHLRDTKTSIDYDIIARVFSTAAAVRQVIVKADYQTSVRLIGEQTHFRFPESAVFYASRDEGEIVVGKAPEDAEASGLSRPMPAWPPATPNEDSGSLSDYPITVDIGNGLYSLMAESDRPHYPRAMLRVLGDNFVGTHLMRYPGRTLGPDGNDAHWYGDGLERTLPNYVALEGVRGNEQFPPARHNVNLAFQRAIVGPMDYTICYAQDRNQTTNAHQLALTVLYYSPQAYLYWYDSWEKYAGKPWPELTWFDDVPVAWDETHAVKGALGEFVVVARRKGTRWYLGAITNEQSRRTTVSLKFLDLDSRAKETEWRAHRYSDGEWNKWVWKTDVKMDELEVTGATMLEIAMNPAGGQAIMFERT